jgi:hypothetical protein
MIQIVRATNASLKATQIFESHHKKKANMQICKLACGTTPPSTPNFS